MSIKITDEDIFPAANGTITIPPKPTGTFGELATLIIVIGLAYLFLAPAKTFVEGIHRKLKGR